jgi:hypothetical protein
MDTTIGYDDTDHFVIFCKCGAPMQITDVGFDSKTKKGFNCVYLYVKCDKCGLQSQRKAYADYDCFELCRWGRE